MQLELGKHTHLSIKPFHFLDENAITLIIDDATAGVHFSVKNSNLHSACTF